MEVCPIKCQAAVQQLTKLLATIDARTITARAMKIKLVKRIDRAIEMIVVRNK